jgi:hypothetical protein
MTFASARPVPSQCMQGRCQVAHARTMPSHGRLSCAARGGGGEGDESVELKVNMLHNIFPTL